MKIDFDKHTYAAFIAIVYILFVMFVFALAAVAIAINDYASALLCLTVIMIYSIILAVRIRRKGDKK